MSTNKVRLRICRQDALDKPNTRRWEEFEVTRFPRMTVIDALRQIQVEPITTNQKRVAPVAWQCSCTEQLCGACAMNINGVAQLACSALLEVVSKKNKPIVLEPLSKFPVVRDLVVDRTKMFEALARTYAWVNVDGTRDTGDVLWETAGQQRQRYELAQCVACGCCVEACPNVNDASSFVGASIINQVSYWGMYPRQDDMRAWRLSSMMERGGVAYCGKAQVCVEVCPRAIPLTESIGRVSRETCKQFLFGWLSS